MSWLVAVMVVILGGISRGTAGLLLLRPAAARPPVRPTAVPVSRSYRTTPRTTRAP